MARRAKGLVLLSALLACTLAGARERIVLVPFAPAQGATVEEAQRFTHLMEAQLGLENLLWTPAPPPRHADPVRPALAEARKRYAARRFTQARGTLEHALAELQKQPAGFEPSTTAAAYVLLGAIELRGGSERRCRAALQQALRLDPGYHPRRGEYPPIFLREIERARKDVARLPRVWLAVDGPAGADVFFDGRRVGILPNVRVHSTRGSHHLELKGLKGEDFAEWVELTSSTTLPVVFPPMPDQSPLPELSGKVLTDALASALAGALSARGAPLAVVGVVDHTPDGQVQAHAALFSGERKGFVVVEPVRFESSFRAAEGEALVLTERLAEARDSNRAPVLLPFDLAPPPPVVATRPATGTARSNTGPLAPRLTPSGGPGAPNPLSTPGVTPPEAGEQGSFLSRVPTWVWIAGGVGLAAGAGATAWALTRNDGHVSGTVEASW